MSRKVAREMAFKAIFAINFQSEEVNPEEIISAEINDSETKLDISKEDMSYIKEVCHGVFEKVSELDNEIENSLKGWKMERISKTDLAILRLAIYEILYRTDIPAKVSINEAIELAKTFSEPSSASFVNGVLGRIMNKSEETNE